MGNELLKMDGITKVYSNGVLANENVSFTVEKGEIHALVGENGAGKSTLMKVLFGLETPDEGAIYLNGNKIKITSPSDAIGHGIGMVHQHFKLVPSLTVAENIVLGIEPKKGIFIDMNKAVKETEELAKKYNFDINPKAVVCDLSVGKKQKVEILKALFRGAKLLILDEPTAVLTPQETRELFEQLKGLKKNGYTIIFISHKLDEIKEICDRLTIMRSGKTMGTYYTANVSEQDISKLMVGRDVVLKVEKKKPSPKDVVLSVKNLNYVNENNKKAVNNVSFSVRSGEILGIAGIEGSGQREIVEMITGLRDIGEGEVTIDGENINPLSIKGIRNLGVSYIPEDRMTYGVAGDVSIEENLISNRYDDKELNGKALFKTNKIKSLTNKLVKDYLIKCKSPSVNVGMLSGGNIQKVVVAREFSTQPKLLIADQPTRGIDVGAIEFIHKKLVSIRDEGCAILLVSADLNEVLELSDSLLVVNNGEIAAYFEDASKLTEEELGFYMLGVKKQSEDEIRRAVYA